MISRDVEIAINGVKVAMAVAAIVFNSSLVFVTVKAKNLHGRCSILIAASSLSIALYSFTYLIQFTVSVLDTDGQGIPLNQCFLFMAVPLFFLNCQYVLFPAIAFDRLIGALFPIWQNKYLHPRKKLYLFLVMTTVAGYATFMLVVSAQNSLFLNPEKQVMCMTPDPAPDYFPQCTLAINASSVFFYVVLWVRVKLWSQQQNGGGFTRGILKSLMAIFALELLGWASNMVIRNVLNILNVSADSQWLILSLVGYIMQMALLLNPIVLYCLSPEYHKAFSVVLMPYLRRTNPTQNHQNFMLVQRNLVVYNKNRIGSSR